ncbi:MAG: hypothetical protein ACJAX3_002618 [Patiriisocius sp.]
MAGIIILNKQIAYDLITITNNPKKIAQKKRTGVDQSVFEVKM